MPDSWPFPEQFTFRWRATAALTRLPTLLLMKFLLRESPPESIDVRPWFVQSVTSDSSTSLNAAGVSQRVQTINLVQLERAIQKRPQGIPLVTVSNHSSCVDDPVLWGGSAVNV